MPDFPGGQKELLSFLSRNIKYPTKAIESKIQGRVIVQFVVNKDGSISNAKIVRSVDRIYDSKSFFIQIRINTTYYFRIRNTAIFVNYKLYNNTTLNFTFYRLCRILDIATQKAQ